MPGPLKNARQERFAQELAKGKSQVEAYEAAGYKPNDGHAARLAGNGRIAARIAELKERAAARTEISVATVTERLLRIADKAESDKQGVSGLSVARAALMDAAKLNGLVIDRTQRELSEEQMKVIVDFIAANPGMAQQLLTQLA